MNDALLNSPVVSVRRAGLVLLGLLVAVFISIWVATCFGAAETYSVTEVAHVIAFKLGLSHEAPAANTMVIIWELRLPRVALALLVGAALAVAGALLQALFENPMADSFVVGVSPGAALGGVIAASLGFQASFGGLNSVTLLAFVGALGTTALVYQLAKRGGKVSVSLLLLTGLAVGGLATAFTTMLLMRLDAFSLRSSMNWLFGSLANHGWNYVLALAPYTAVGIAVSIAFWRELNLLSLGEETAHHLGVPLERTKLILLVTAALLAAASVAASGIIGFVGLIVPHIVRKLAGPNHRLVLTGSVLAGGLLLLWADLFSRQIVMSEEMPIGVITSILGGLFFLGLLARTKSRLA
jgi:iron complex transport system permease protein